MQLIGLTGGIASGKSTVGDMLRGAGIVVIDADVLAREAVAPESPGLAAIVETFGDGMLRADGTLDRAALGARVFSDDAARARLNAIVHPEVAARAAQRIAAERAAGTTQVVYEVPLLFENGLDEAVDATIVVWVPPDVQLARLMDRDSLDENAAQARIAAQMPLAEKAARATHVIDNTGSETKTAAQLAAVWVALTDEERAFAAAPRGKSAPTP